MTYTFRSAIYAAFGRVTDAAIGRAIDAAIKRATGAAIGYDSSLVMTLFASRRSD